MATSYTHAIVGLGLAQIYRPARHRWLCWSLCAFLAVIPDIDALSSASYRDILGHRGCTHSLIVALWFAFFVASLTYRLLGGSLWALTGVFFLATASHAVLDAFTRGGMPIRFFWPATNQRFGDWGPIPVSDIAWDLPDPWRSRSIRSEMLWVWIPMGVLVFAIGCIRRLKQPAK